MFNSVLFYHFFNTIWRLQLSSHINICWYKSSAICTYLKLESPDT